MSKTEAKMCLKNTWDTARSVSLLNCYEGRSLTNSRDSTGSGEDLREECRAWEARHTRCCVQSHLLHVSKDQRLAIEAP